MKVPPKDQNAPQSIEEYFAIERIRKSMDTDLYNQLMSFADDDHFHILKDNAPPDYWNDSLVVQVWLKLGLLKKKKD